MLSLSNSPSSSASVVLPLRVHLWGGEAGREGGRVDGGKTCFAPDRL